MSAQCPMCKLGYHDKCLNVTLPEDGFETMNDLCECTHVGLDDLQVPDPEFSRLWKEFYE